MSDSLRAFVLFILIVIYPVAYPNIFSLGDGRFGSGGSLILIFNAILLLSRKEKLNIIDFSTILINVFVMASGERADTILILLLFYLIKYQDGHLIERKISNVKLIFLLFITLLLGLFSGLNRMGGSFSMEYLIYYIFNQGTVIDVLHVYLSSIWYVNKYGYNFEPIINLISSFIPFTPFGGASSSYNVTSILRNIIPNVGGGLFYSAGYLSYGLFGASIYVAFYGFFIRKLFIGGNISKVLFIAIFLQQLRLQWYGLNYMGNVVSMGLLILSFIFLIKYVANKY
ncbi:hypothetical protein [Photobacterium leiognathi]|uniref:hypothetical protein n=1 Tax=Photobacterium leiognathi TaxID=553611 RepID=UPI0011B2857B|nr:hypothetical protein [Photobacterium leiognathi]